MKLSDDAKKARNEYMKKWRKENRERYLELNRKHQEDFWSRKAEEMKQKVQ
jgi:hypothetical protein